MGGKAQTIKHIPYKAGQILLGPIREDDTQSKVKIIKYNSAGHYRIAVYFIDAHDVVAQVFTNMHHSTFDRAKLSLGLSGLLKRL